MTRCLALFGCIAAAFVIFYASARTPDPAPAGAPPTAFSAGRAMADIRGHGLGAPPRGSPANARVRDYLVGRMRPWALRPRSSRAGSRSTAGGARVVAGAVENVIGVLPGRDRSPPALALMAHHDSVPGSPGAADDTTGVASALEIVRAIKAAGRAGARRDGGDHRRRGGGALGARAFFGDSPLAAHVGYVINMETPRRRRPGGDVRDRRGDGADIALYRRTAAAPGSNALTVFVYQHMPNDTDFSVARATGSSG